MNCEYGIHKVFHSNAAMLTWYQVSILLHYISFEIWVVKYSILTSTHQTPVQGVVAREKPVRFENGVTDYF